MAAVLGLALLARIVAAFLIGDEFRFWDETKYVDAAARLLAGDGFDPRYSHVPAFPVLLALLDPSGANNLLLLRLGHAALTGMGALALFVFVNRFAGYGPALAGMLLYALDPLMVISGALLYPEAMTAVVLVLTCIAALSAGEEARPGAAIAAGLGLALLCMLRPVGLAVVPAIAIWLLFASSGPGHRRVVPAAILLGVTLLALTPWTVRNYQVHGRLVAIAEQGIQREAEQPEATDETTWKAPIFLKSILERIANDPVEYLRRTMAELGHFWELYPTKLATDLPEIRAMDHENDDRLPKTALFPASLRNTVSIVTSSLEYLLALFGLVLCWRRHKRETALIVLVVTLYSLAYSPFYAKLRYRIPVLPFVYALGGLTLSSVMQRFVAGRRRRTQAP